MLGLKKPTREEATMILGDVAPEKCFWVNNGSVLHNMYDLLNALKVMDDAKFTHHAGKEKNDFANWAADVLHDAGLARHIRLAKNQKQTLEVITKRIGVLEKLAYAGKEQEGNKK